MDERQHFLRYAVPGIAVAIVFVLALVVVHPGIICLFDRASTSWQLVSLILSGLIASGGLGFLLAQIYFGLPSWFNTANHCDVIEDSVPKKPEAKRLKWLGTWWANFNCKGNAKRLKAHREVRYRFQSLVGEDKTLKVLHRTVNLSAQRMASIGATVTGLVILFLAWLWLATRDLAFLERLCPDLSGIMPAPPYQWICGFACFILPTIALLRARYKIRMDLENIVKEALESGQSTEKPAIPPTCSKRGPR